MIGSVETGAKGSTGSLPVKDSGEGDVPEVSMGSRGGHPPKELFSRCWFDERKSPFLERRGTQWKRWRSWSR